MANLTEVKGLIEAALPGATVIVNDLTGGGDHLSVNVAAPQFAGKGLIDQHQMIYAALKHKMAPVSQEIHALQIKTSVP
ncbi:MAG: BolA/IbaG family iron-sulfur metabolism protein [Acidobacteriota bacterium]